MAIKTISEEGCEDYEVWTCDTCGYEIVLAGVGGDVCECPKCMEQEYKAEAEHEAMDDGEAIREAEARAEDVMFCRRH